MQACILCGVSVDAGGTSRCQILPTCRTGHPCCDGCCTHRGDYIRPGDRVRVREASGRWFAGREATVIIVRPFTSADMLAIAIALDEPADPTIAASAEIAVRPRELQIVRAKV